MTDAFLEKLKKIIADIESGKATIKTFTMENGLKQTGEKDGFAVYEKTGRVDISFSVQDQSEV